MSKAPNARPVERMMKIPYRESRTYQTVTADSTVVLAKTDEVSAAIQLNFVRVDHAISNERIKVAVEGNMQRQIAPSEFDQTPVKILECSVLMRPDQALQMVGAVLNQLTQMPEHVKLQFGLHNISLTPPEAPQA